MMQLTGRSVRTEFALDAVGPRTWTATVDPSWRGWTGPHGGVITGLLVDVARAAAGAVRAVDMRFLGRPRDGAFVFEPCVHTVGRSTTIVDVTAYQNREAVAAGSITLGRTTVSGVAERSAGAGGPGASGGHARADGAGLDVAPPEDCDLFALPPEIVPVGAHFEIRPAAGPLPLSGSDRAWMCAWIALVPELVTDAASLAVLADALPPTIFPTLTVPLAVPTVAMSLYAHTDLAVAPAQPVLVTASNVSTGGGWSVDDVDIRDRAGRLLVQARQTRRVVG
ncbi:thioesterase family protein [Nocardia crassostreae]|uniref:thioesterase family protein n=1 Tax=Nocardia crassostreae TaxID=53428 RepID=UPI00082E6148|nr:thioesterase family protein [Nocardia crassostreae]